MLVNEHNSMPYMKSLSTCLNRMIHEGYTEDFKVTDNGLESLQHAERYTPEQIHIVNFFRFEGNSDPEDSAILYIIETANGRKGTLIDAYSIYSDERTNQFIKQVEDFHKKVAKL